MRTFIVTLIALVTLMATIWFWIRNETPNNTAANNTATPTKQSVPTKPYTKRTIGTSVENRPIEVYQFSARSSTSSPLLLFVGGMHGGYEWNSALFAYELIDTLVREATATPRAVAVDIIPTLNPDGLWRATQREGRFTLGEVPPNAGAGGVGRFNANEVDLNRNFDCNWQSTSTWRGKTVRAGTEPFSEPEAAALRDYIQARQPDAVIFFHSKAGAVYASECNDGILPETLNLTRIYADEAGYRAVESFDAYKITGDAEGWLASLGIPAITVEFTTHTSTDYTQNMRGVRALINHYSPQP